MWLKILQSDKCVGIEYLPELMSNLSIINFLVHVLCIRCAGITLPFFYGLTIQPTQNIFAIPLLRLDLLRFEGEYNKSSKFFY